MATPRVFVSSTYYDLKYIRENLKYFIRTIGYEPALSEEGDVFYNPRKHTHDSCVSEVPSCQMFVLIIGGRYGGKYKSSDKSITNEEFNHAIKSKLPVFAMVESSVYAEHHVYNENLKHVGKTQADKIKYPSVDNVKVFEFIDEVRKRTINNGIVPFRDFSDIESYLKKQWAGMMFSYLTEDIEESKITDTLSALTQMSSKIEILSTQILNSVGSDKAMITIKLYEKMISYEVFRDLGFLGIKPAPKDILKHNEFTKLCNSFGVNARVYDEDDESDSYSISSSGEMGGARLENNKSSYKVMHSELIKILQENTLTLSEYLNEK